MRNLLFFLIALVLGFSCNQNTNKTKKEKTVEETGIFPEVKNVNAIDRTDFVPTLERSFDFKNNMVYAATIPLAWNEIRTEIGGTLGDFESAQLEEINNTKSYIDVLKENEYETSVIVDEYIIKASAYFRKSLPFDEPLRKFDEPLLFNDTKVESFGLWSSHDFAKINYFNSAEDFSISLLPTNDEHEIILIMQQGLRKDLSSFSQYFQNYQEQSKLEKNKYIHFNDDDKVEIPIIEFNLEKSFDEIIGTKFKSKKSIYTMLETYQRNAFILNEKGAEVESYTVEAAADAVEEMEKPKPKLMIFDKPFVVFLKRKDAEYPYFAVRISNTELLKIVK